MKKSVPIEDKLYFVKLLTSKMEERAGSDTKMMVASINAKLEMINQLIGWWVIIMYLQYGSLFSHFRALRNSSFWNLQDSNGFVDLAILWLIKRSQSSIVIFPSEVAEQFFILDFLLEFGTFSHLFVFGEEQFFSWHCAVPPFQTVFESSKFLYGLFFPSF